jgi:SAM-dependent methyltransferase
VTAPVPPTTPEAILQVATGFMAAKHLFIASEIGLFAAIADAGGGATLAELAARTGVAPRRVRIVADAVTALGFLTRDGERYHNAPVAETFLAGHPGPDMRPHLRFWNRLSYPAWMGYEHAVRTGERARHEFTAEEQAIFSAGVEAITTPTAMALPSAYDFAAHRRLLDLGGGTGSFLVRVLEQYPALAGAVFDVPAVEPLARARLAASPAAARATVVSGDIMRDPLPRGYDAVLVANVVHYFEADGVRALLERVRAAVEPGARLLLVDLWTDPTHTQPLPAALMAGEFLTLVGGDVYSEAEMAGWLRETGWTPLGLRPLAGPQSLIVAEAR